MTEINKPDNKLLSTALQQIDDAVFITDTSGEILYVNKAFERMTGYSAGESIGKKPSIISSGVHEEAYFDELWETILAGNVFRKQVVNKKKNGELFYADHTITPIKDDKGEITYFVASWKDITEQVEEQQNRTELIKLVSHELKTPITTVKTFTQLLLRRSDREGDQEQKIFFERMDNQINKLVSFINDLLDVSNLEGSGLKFNYKTIDFDEFIEHSVEENKIYINNHKIQINGESNAMIKADPARLDQVLSNLLTNACKFSPHQYPIILERKREDGSAILLVKDKGVGIPEQEQQKIFAPYQRVKSKKNRSIPGVGLGLYISSEIVKKHNGDIWVESTQGKGSTFGISIPIHK